MFGSALRAHALLDLPRGDPPAFAQAAPCARLDAPFREGVAAICRAPGEVVLYAQLPPVLGLPSVPLHWEVARDVAMRERERYGLRAARPGEIVQIPLLALERGRAYWYRLWAGGEWSHIGHFHSGLATRSRAAASRPARAPAPAARESELAARRAGL